MKVAFATLVVVGATLTNAIALAEPEAFRANRGGRKGFCGVQGVSCARDAGACGVPGNPCARLKRSADAVADAFAIADPIAKKGGRKGFCGVQGVSCAKAKRDLLDVGSAVEEAVTNIYAREADANAEAEAVRAKKGGRKGFCGVQGVSCARRLMTKREAEAEAEAEAVRAKKGGRKGFCGVQGVSCAKTKREAEAEAEAEAVRAKKGGRKGFCGVQGVSCAKAKREAEAEAVRAKKGGRKGFCGVQGVSCAKVKRDVEPTLEEDAIVARSADNEDPTAEALREAHAAFMFIKREAEAISEEATPFELLAFCAEHDCDEETVQTIAARAAGTFDERDAEACNAPGGACDIAKRQLDDIEAKLTAAVEAL